MLLRGDASLLRSAPFDRKSRLRHRGCNPKSPSTRCLARPSYSGAHQRRVLGWWVVFLAWLRSECR